MTGIITSIPPLVEQPPGQISSNPAGLPGVTYTFALLQYAQTWTAKQTFPLGNIALNAGDIAGLTNSSVGLGNVDNTSDASKPVSTATQTALNLKAPLISPSFTTPSLGAATATSINGASIDNNAWTSYTPSLTFSSGTVTTASATGFFKVIGKTVFISITATITTFGTATGTIFSLPSGHTMVGNTVLPGRETGVTGSMLQGFGLNGASTVAIRTYADSLTLANGYVQLVNGTYQIP